MTIINIVFLERATIGPGVTLRASSFEHEWQDHQQTDEKDVVARLAKADIAITNKVGIAQSMLHMLPNYAA